ncbi:hypothetical protein ACS0TY_013609 [Phlomoides rotata]
MVSIEDNVVLTVLPNADEVRRVVFDMEPSSSPGLEDFRAVMYFFETLHIPFGLNSSFVMLISKKPGANRVEDFRPIVIGHITQISRALRYIFYADDILIFAKDTTVNIRHLQSVLSNYGSLSGQLYNPTKYKFCFGSMLRCTCIIVGSIHFTYLGVPLFRGSPRTCHLAALSNSIINKWKGHSLSLAGHKCMVNFVITTSFVHSIMI